jgi:phosphate:Na+ symporter
VERIRTLSADYRLRRLAALLARATASYSLDAPSREAAERFDRLRQVFRRQRHRYRVSEVGSHRGDGRSGAALLARLDAARWLQRVSYHLWRIHLHLASVRKDGEGSSPTLMAAESEDATKI